MTRLRPNRFARALAAALPACALLFSSPASAVQYEVEIDVENELQLNDLYAQGVISQFTLETLTELMREGVDLNSAKRAELYELPNITYKQVDAILKYRKQVGTIHDPGELVQAQAIPARLLEQIAPFLVVSDEEPFKLPVTGRFRSVSAYAVSDPLAPPVFLQLRLRGPYDLTAGVAAVEQRRRIDDLGWDATRKALVADAPTVGVSVPKFFLLYKPKGSQISAVAGSFRIGFGQRLTLDNTTRYTPDGFYADDVVEVSADLSKQCNLSAGELGESPCTAEEKNTYVTQDFSWRETFRGAAASFRGIEIGSGELAVHAFGSYQSRSIYQYEVFDAAACKDPHDDDDEACKAPPIYQRGKNPAPKFSYVTLPGAYDELIGGGHVAMTFLPGAQVGVTGYAAKDFWSVPGADLDFQEWSRTPFGGPFGAVGVDGAAQLGDFDLFIEGARSFDSMPEGGGGFGAIQRTTWAVARKQELELSLRYYDRDFANPYGRPIAEPDEFEGQRARNEAGGRLRYLGKPSDDWALRAEVDLSTWPSDGAAADTKGTTNLDTYLRGDFVGLRWLKAGAWVQYKNKDLGTGGRGNCYESSTENDPDGEPIPCSGEFLRVAGKVTTEPFGPILKLGLQYQHELVDDKKYQDSFRQDHALWFEASSKPIEQLRLRGRVRYFDEGLDNEAYLERSVWGYLDATFLWEKLYEVGLRYDLYRYLDTRDATLERASPNDHRLRLELVAKF